MIRLCPNCNTERPLTEIFCEGTVDAHNCGWDLSTVDITRIGTPATKPQPIPPSVGRSTCRNGHENSPGDLVCSVCGEAVEEPTGENPDALQVPLPQPEPDPEPVETVIEGWRLQERMTSSSTVRERFAAVRESDGQRGVLTLYASGSEPDGAIYVLLRKLPRDHVPEIFATGRWCDRAYEVVEEFTGGTLADLPPEAEGPQAIRILVAELGLALHSLSEAGLRHRDLRPSTILIRSRDPLDLVITGFGSARLSEFDLDIASPLETTRYMAPEAIAGGVAPASDWWSLGMILLERVTSGACFQGINEQAFLIHVLTNGVPLPDNLNAATELLLRGLLARDRRQRWQWKEVQAWLAGEPVSTPEAAARPEDVDGRASISLGGKQYRSPGSFALAAAEAANWDEAKDLLLRGGVATWASEAGFEPRIPSTLRQFARAEGLTDDLRLSIALKTLNPSMPLIVRGNIVTPGWLLDHPDDGYNLITGPAPDLIRKVDPDDWLWRLKLRAETVRKRLQQLEIAVDEETLRVHLLSTSMARLAALWEEKRKLLPDTDHAGVISLIERRQSAEEDLVILLSASPSQFRSVAEVVEESAKEASSAGLAGFSREGAGALLTRPRREIYRLVDDRIENFARCGLPSVDEWANQFRLDRRMPIGRALALLSVPSESWKPLPKQGYVSTILDFFAKRISGGVLRGPLTRMLIGKTARVDLTELDTSRVPATEILEHLLARGTRTVNIDPATFSENDGLERRLRSLHSHALLYRRDTGIDGLYMAFPFLLIRDSRPTAKPRIAPVLLWPVRVLPEVGNRGHVTLGYGREKSADIEAEHVIVNPALEGMVGIPEAKRWQEAAQELLARATFSTLDVMDAFGQLATSGGNTLAPLPGKDVKIGAQERQVVPSAVLFHLAFMGQAVMKDLELLRGLPPSSTALEAALRLSDQKPEGGGSVHAREIERFFTADSDPSQESAVMEARQAPGLVIEGPPGTGKSQTIVNMVADAIGMGKSLLVVCQKQAALEVVRKRLEKERLGSRFVMITDINRDREAIVSAVREQVEHLHNQPSGGAPAWKRDRERLAARIETLEADLDRQQTALHAVDPRTGLTYRTLLGELLAIEAAQPKPIDLPSIRPLLTDLHPADVVTLEENCGPLARFWLSAKFEGNSLSVLKLFNPDRGTADTLMECLRAFAEIDTRREGVDAQTSNSLDVADPESLRTWLESAGNLRSIGDALCSNLGRWLPLFRSPEGDGSRGTNMLAGLIQVEAGLSALNASHHEPGISEKLVSVPSGELLKLSALAKAVLSPASGLGHINPMRWIRKRRLRNLMAAMEIVPDDEGLLTFDNAIDLETGLRPLRLKVANYLIALFNRAPDSKLPPAQLAALAGNLHSIVTRVHGFVSLIDQCPQKAELDQAAMTGAMESLVTFFGRADRSLQRHDARAASYQALEQLQPYLDEIWIGLRRSAIHSGRSNSAAIGLIFEAAPTLASYQEFRLRSVRLGEAELKIFRTLRGKETDLVQLPAGDLDACVRGTIAREARIAWKIAMESSSPEVLFDGDASDVKVKSLAEADRQIRNCNRELLVNGIDPGRVRPMQDWEPITRLRGQRALRLREFIDRGTALGLFALRPVWLMTPDVASRVLQPKPGLFDTVIFDEASQMPVEYSLPALFRSKIVVVSGDEKQMPPTSFFASKVENDEAAIFDGEEPEDAASEEERDVFTETWNRREIKDCPDLLQLARSVLRSRTLQVHYRSEYRELISFSNASFYGNRLSVPARHPEDIIRKIRPIEMIRSDGVYKNQTNPKEAADVVEYLSNLWEDASPPSAGVVTFNRKQADAIEDALEERAEEDASFRDALMRERERAEGGEDMGFFVKNVENVQGDERDVVIFSTTFGRNEHGVFRKSFGALGHAGGERRLNVAVTRARKKVVMITSMPISEISDLLTTRRGPRVPRDYLQGYLEYARTVSEGTGDSGRALLDRMVTDKGAPHDLGNHEDDGFTKSVEDFMKAQGWTPAKARDGGAFSLDFAITDPRTGLYAIGVECDAPRHRLLEKARAREVWRPNVLSKAVPHIHRVSSYAWTHSGDAERQHLKEKVENALRSEGGFQ
jgi:primosomal replication protein N''